MTNKLTPAQRGAMHLYFEHLANALNDAGLDMKVVFARKPHIKVSWTKDSVKEYLFKPVMKAMTGKDSTEQMNTLEPEMVYKELDRHTSAELEVHIEWPSEESQYNESQGIK